MIPLSYLRARFRREGFIERLEANADKAGRVAAREGLYRKAQNQRKLRGR